MGVTSDLHQWSVTLTPGRTAEMPKSNRDKVLKKYDQADNDLDRCLTNLRDLSEIYKPAHSKHYAAVMSIAEMVILVQTTLKNIRQDLA